MTSALVASTCLAAAVLLARPVPRGATSLPWVLATACLGLVGAAVLVLGGGLASPGALARFVAPALVLVTMVVGGVLVRRRHLAASAAVETASRVQEVCELLSAELASGRPVDRCLDDAAEMWTPMGSVATAHRLGSPVPDALRTLADLPGASDLRLVAAAWQVAQRSGGGLAEALSEVAESLRMRRATRRLVRSELSSARSTARLIAVLPGLTLLLGSGTGGDPVGFLLTSPVGLGCLTGGVLLTLLGLWWIEGIAGSVEAAA